MISRFLSLVFSCCHIVAVLEIFSQLDLTRVLFGNIFFLFSLLATA
jgi:hypothetical protein